jgi:hypothetical protein
MWNNYSIWVILPKSNFWMQVALKCKKFFNVNIFQHKQFLNLKNNFIMNFLSFLMNYVDFVSFLICGCMCMYKYFVCHHVHMCICVGEGDYIYIIEVHNIINIHIRSYRFVIWTCISSIQPLFSFKKKKNRWLSFLFNIFFIEKINYHIFKWNKIVWHT